MSNNKRCDAWRALDAVQLGRNFTETKQTLPEVPTEPPWKWLAHVIGLPPAQQRLLQQALATKLAPQWEVNVKALYGNPLIQQIAGNSNYEDREIDILKLAQSCRTDLLVEELKCSGVQNVSAWAKDLSKAQGNDEAYQDYYIEGWYAQSLARSGLLVVMKPTGSAGPDLKVTVDRDEIFVEVSRFREAEALRKQMEQSAGILKMPETSLKILRKISRESVQLVCGKPGVILLHSTNVGVDGIEFQRAVERRAITLARVSAIILRDTWRKVGDGANPTCWGFINGSATARIQPKALQRVGQCLDSNFRIVNGSGGLWG
ncbi:MAG: hypothetical protein Q8O40_10045 [Chloroflexota bacterium]|nr:hypothetical protein [Chloroflexota bacterium]